MNHQRLGCEIVNINKISINLNYHPSCCDRNQLFICAIHDIHYGIAASLLNYRIIDIDVSFNANVIVKFTGLHLDNCTLYNPTNKIKLMGSAITFFPLKKKKKKKNLELTSKFGYHINLHCSK